MENLNTKAAYKALKLTRNLINISLVVIFLVLLFWGNYNPAAAFAMIFYNALHWLLLSNNKSAQINKDASYLIELNVLRITLFAGILLHLILGYGFMYKLPIKIEEFKILPFALALVIIIFRYLSYFYFKIKFSKKSR